MIFDLSEHMAKRERLHDPVRDRIWKRAEMEANKHQAEINLHIRQIELEKMREAYVKAVRECHTAEKNYEMASRALAAFDEGTRAYIEQQNRG